MRKFTIQKSRTTKGGDFVTNQDHGEAFPSKLAATGILQDQFSDDEYLKGGVANHKFRWQAIKTHLN